MDHFSGEVLEGGGAERVDSQLDVLHHCGLDGDVGERVVGLVDIGREEFGRFRTLLYAVDPDLQLGVIVCQNFVWVVVDYWLECGVLGRLGKSLRGL